MNTDREQAIEFLAVALAIVSGVVFPGLYERGYGEGYRKAIESCACLPLKEAGEDGE